MKSRGEKLKESKAAPMGEPSEDLSLDSMKLRWLKQLQLHQLAKLETVKQIEGVKSASQEVKGQNYKVNKRPGHSS